MRRGLLAAAGLAFLATVSLGAPAQAMAISAPAALKAANDSVKLTANVHCWDCGYYGRPAYYRPYRPYYRPYYRAYDRPYYSGYQPYYRPYRPYYRPYSYGGGYGYGYYRPRPRFYVGPNVYWY
jgi:hypothetical protein